MDEPALVVLWERVLGDLLDRTARFPKAERFTFAARIDGHALDLLECLVRARYAPPAEKVRELRAADTHLAVLRVLVRLSHGRRYLDHGGLEHVSRGLDEAGRMLGGWLRSLPDEAPG